MKAAVFQEANKPLTIEDVDIVDPRAGEEREFEVPLTAVAPSVARRQE